MQIDTRGYLCQFEPFSGEDKDRAFSDKGDLLALLYRVLSVEGDLLYLFKKLFNGAVFEHVKFAAVYLNLLRPGGKGAEKVQLLSVLGDIDKTTGSRKFTAETTDVNMAFGAGFC